MLTSCPKCRQTYVGKSCPRCQPSMQRGRGQRVAVPWDNPLTPGHWSQNPWVRCGVGIAVAQGLFLGLRRWSEASVSFFGPEGMELNWSGYTGFAFWGALQFLSVMLGSMLVGSGQRDWIFYGLAVGFINTIIDLAVAGRRFYEIEPILIVTLMVASFLAGVIGCRLGAMVWKPLDAYKSGIELKEGSARQKGGIAVKDLFTGINFLTIKVNWLRILIGVSIGVLGLVFARSIFYNIVNMLGLRGALEQAQDVRTGVFVIMIQTLSVFLAGLIAGTNSSNGPAHGFWSGLLLALSYAGWRYVTADASNPWVPESVLAYAFTYLGLCIVGSILGSRLLPPVIHTGKRQLTKVAEI